MAKPTRSSPESFWASFSVHPGTGCWEWTGPISADSGYGAIYSAGILPGPATNILAHRVAWVLKFGPIPDGKLVRHRCDNPLCGNPDHLLLGTNTQNAEDKASRLRVWGTKLTFARVEDIRRRYAGGETQYAIAKDLGIDQSTVSKIVTGKARTIPSDVEVPVHRKPRVALTDVVLLEIQEAIRQGATHQSTADRYGVSRKTVERIANGRTYGLRPVGGNRRRAVRLDPGLHDEIRARLTRGETQQALAAEYGISQQTVSNVKRGAHGPTGTR